MIISNKDATARLSNPMNLMNRLRENTSNRKNAMSLFGIGRSNISEEIKLAAPTFVSPFEKVPETSTLTIDTLVSNNEDQIKLSLAHDTALDTLTKSVILLRDKLDDVKADRLPTVIAATSKVVESIRKERTEIAKSNKGKEVHYHFYTPEQKKISDYEVVEVS